MRRNGGWGGGRGVEEKGMGPWRSAPHLAPERDATACIDLILTNKPSYFQTTTVIETGISDFHKLTVTVLKSSFRKQEPKIFSYRNYEKFNIEKFRNDLFCEISKKGFSRH